MLHGEITASIIGAAMTVLNELRPGLDEKLYERALTIELRRRGHTVQQQPQFPVFYRGEHIGTLVPDLIVDGKVVVDTKVVTCFTETHISKMIGYLSISNLSLALLLNFHSITLQWKRVIREINGTADDADSN